MGKKPEGAKVAALRAAREAQAAQAEIVDPMKYHADRITTSWRESVNGIIETGRRLLEAKEELEHGKWSGFVDDKLPFDRRTAQRLMEIASGRLAAASPSPLLPPSWTTLYQLTKLDDDGWKRVKPHLHPTIKGSEVRRLAAAPKPEAPQPEPQPACPTCGRPMIRGL